MPEPQTPDEIRAELARMEAFWQPRGWIESAARRYKRLQRELAAAKPQARRPAITFDTTEYRFSHGRQPAGRGGWAFEHAATGTEFWAASDTLTGAKKQLKARADLPGGTWKVLP